MFAVYYPPSTTSAAQMMHDLALEFVRLGHQVTVATPCDSVQGRVRVTDEEGVAVVRVKIGDLKYANKAVRLWRESRLSAMMWRGTQKYFENSSFELIVFYSPTIFFGDIVRRLKSMWGCPSYLVLRDIFPKWAVDAGVLREGILYRYLKHKELVQYAASDVIGVEAPGNLSYFEKELLGDRHHVEVLYNWLDMQERRPCRPYWRKRLGLLGKIVFFYGGNIGVVQDMDNILRLAAGLGERKDIFFLLMGSGSEVQRITAQIELQGMRNIKILPPEPQQEYLQCLSECDVGLVSLDRRLTSHNFTGKMLGYVLCGKPILASLNPGNDLIKVLRDANAGIACTNGEDEALRTAALTLAEQDTVRQRMGENARMLGETTFSVRSVAQQILAHSQLPQDGVMSIRCG